MNGPTEGILIGVAMKLLTAFYGPHIWFNELVPGIQNNTLFVLATVIGTAGTLITKYVSSRDNARRKGKLTSDVLYVTALLMFGERSVSARTPSLWRLRVCFRS